MSFPHLLQRSVDASLKLIVTIAVVVFGGTLKSASKEKKCSISYKDHIKAGLLNSSSVSILHVLRIKRRGVEI